MGASDHRGYKEMRKVIARLEQISVRLTKHGGEIRDKRVTQRSEAQVKIWINGQ